MREKPKKQMRIWAVLCHLSALLAWIVLFFLVFIGIPLYLPLNILAPLLVWRYKKSQSSWVDFQGRESLNFQISLTFYILVVIIVSLFFVLTSCGVAVTTNGKVNEVKTTLDALLIMFLSLIISMSIIQSFVVTFASIKAYRGQHFRYPLTMKFLR